MTILNMVYLKSSGGSGRPTITGFTYDNKNWNYNWSTYGDANGIAFKPDGTKVYIGGESKNTVYQFSLGTAWDITTATYDNKSKSVSSQTNPTESVLFSKDGTIMWVGGGWNTSAKLYKYTLSTAWDVSTASYSNVSSNISFDKCTSYKFGNNGNYLFQLTRDSKYIRRYTMITPYDITTLQGNSGQYQELSISITNTPHEVVLNAQGTQMFILDRAKKIYLYTLSTAWDLTTATQIGSYSIPTPNSNDITSMCIDNNGSKMYLGGYNIGGIYQYTTTTS